LSRVLSRDDFNCSPRGRHTLLVAEPRSMAESSNPALTSTANPRTWQPAINPDHYARNRQHPNPSTGADE